MFRFSGALVARYLCAIWLRMKVLTKLPICTATGYDEQMTTKIALTLPLLAGPANLTGTGIAANGIAGNRWPDRARKTGCKNECKTGRERTAAKRAALTVFAVGALWFAPAVVEAKVRIAVPEFKVEGDGTPALALQLQDGFVLGLVRAGIQVLDPVDVGRKLEATPELGGCDSSACLKNIGRLLSVNYVVRVKIDVAGNSYKMVARLFSAEGATPAGLPISTKSRTCDVCTVAEAREYMIKLADALKGDVEEVAPPPVAPPRLPPPPPPSLVPSLVAAMGGAVAVGIGVALFVTMPDCHATGVPTCDENRLRSAVAGGLIGAGAVTSIVGTSITIYRSRMPPVPGAPGTGTVTTVAVAIPF